MTRTLTGTVVTGDGSTIHEPGHVVIDDGTVVAVGPGEGPSDGREDLRDAIIAPGLVNLHAHGLTPGPIHATGSPSLTPEQIHAFKDRHLHGGTTTALCVDGFPTWDESQRLAGDHPLTVIKCTAHSASNVRAAHMADGTGLSEEHEHATIHSLLEQGARCIGEIGAGGTLGGGMQDYAYIPAAFKERFDVELTARDARAFKEAVLGRAIDPAHLRTDQVLAVLETTGLTDRVSVEAVVDTIVACVMPSMEYAYEGLREAARASAETGAPFLVHHAAASADVVVSVAGERMIAGHCNHPSFLPDEAVHYARELRRLGAALELSGLNLLSGDQPKSDAEPFWALVHERLVDFVGTDYAGGDFDAVSVPLFAIVRNGAMGLAETLALSTGNVTTRFPELTDAGLLEPGRPADVAIFDAAFTSVQRVIKSGRDVHAARGVRSVP